VKKKRYLSFSPVKIFGLIILFSRTPPPDNSQIFYHGRSNFSLL
jgi:hypothetical protein